MLYSGIVSACNCQFVNTVSCALPLQTPLLQKDTFQGKRPVFLAEGATSATQNFIPHL